MNIKNTIIAVGCLLAMPGVHSCIDDRGSSPFASAEETMPMKITEMKDTVVEIRSILKITPEINGREEGRKYSYLWYAASSVTAGVAPQRDTLSQAPDLTFPVTYESGTYNLVFEVRDVERNIYARTQLLMTVASNFAYGWYVIKDEADKTDFDFILPNGTVQNNVLQASGMQPLEGKAKKLTYQSQRYYHEIDNPDGTVTTLANKKALYVLSERDMLVLNADNMSLFKDFNKSFYEAPTTKRLQNCHTAGGDAYLINAGKIYSIYGMSSNVGKFSYAKSGIHELHDDIVGSTAFGDITIWDKTSRTFFSTSSSGATLNKFSDQTNLTEPVQVSPTEMPVELIRLLKRNDYPPTAYAVMKHPTKEEYYLADMVASGYPFVSFDTLPAQSEMPESDVMAAHGISSCIYFGKGSDLKVHMNNIAHTESVLKNFPGETITYIENIRSSNKNDKFNHLVVLTNSSAGWKLYRFEIVGETPDINPEPVKVYSGQGTGRHVIFRI